MNHPKSVLVQRSIIVISAMILLVVVARAQDADPGTNPSQDQYEKKTYIEQNGTWQWTRTMEDEHHFTSEGEVEIQRFRAPAYEGDKSVSWERETRTRKLPDGTVEKEYILRRPDGSGRLVPTQIVREESAAGTESTVVHRETLERPGGTEWQAVKKETIEEQGPPAMKQGSREVQRLNLTTHGWEIVEEEKSSRSTKNEGGTTETEVSSVRQTPGSTGKLEDFERRREHTISSEAKQITESTVYRRDLSTSAPGHFYLLDHSTTEVTADSGSTTRHQVRESDWLFDNNGRTYSRHPEVVEEKIAVQTTSPDGSLHTVTKVAGRTSAEGTSLRPIYTVMEDSDTAGYVRRIYIPAN